MDRDRSFSAIPRDLNGVGPAAEQVDVFGKDEFLRYLRQGVVVTVPVGNLIRLASEAESRNVSIL
jgi:hypothetical protein